ncbi:MAG: hypothetical protein FWG12_01165, partial [Holophagaceae bacterium]|nr:hypothetical protein [Holophagaceae bacterium]
IPLEKGAEIRCANAHRIDWETIVPKVELSYILGNPPFIGYSNQSQEQKQDIHLTCLDKNGKPIKNAAKIDYVAAWYYRASKYIQGTQVRAAFVSTNSITQGEQVANVWKPLFDMFGIHIDFAYRAFKWDSEAKGKAAVHCVIVGFSKTSTGEKIIYDGEGGVVAKNINPYLVDAPNVWVESRRMPICEVPEMQKGSMPNDGGNLIIDDLAGFLKTEPGAKPFIRLLLGSDEFINNKKRWCLWLDGVSPKEWRNLAEVKRRVECVRKIRSDSKRETTRKLADTPMLFGEIRQPETNYLAVPEVSSERRRYIPIGYLPASTVVTNKIFTIPNTDLYHFGILTSIVHMAWTRAVCGRMKSDYSYSNIVVYNNFPWPEVTAGQRTEIKKLAKSVLNARELFKNNSLADLYDPDAMPKELLKVHRELDRAVMKLYGFGKDMPEPEIVAKLMEMHKTLVATQKNAKA